MMKRKCLYVLFATILSLSAYAQFQPQRLTFGGGVGMQFGDYTSVNIAPQVGYNFSRYLNAGAGFSYTYFGDKWENFRQKNHYLGFNVYGRVYPIQYIVLTVQPEVSRMWRTLENRSTGVKETTEKFIPTFLVGGGVRLGPVTAMIQYDVVGNDDSPYGGRVVYSIGYTFGF